MTYKYKMVIKFKTDKGSFVIVETPFFKCNHREMSDASKMLVDALCIVYGDETEYKEYKEEYKKYRDNGSFINSPYLIENVWDRIVDNVGDKFKNYISENNPFTCYKESGQSLLESLNLDYNKNYRLFKLYKDE